MNMEKPSTNMGVKPDEEEKEEWGEKMLDIGEKLGYPKEEVENHIQEIRRLQKEIAKGGGEYREKKLEKSLGLESFLIEKMNLWDIKYEMEEEDEDEDIIITTNKFDDLKNKGDLLIYDEKKKIMIMIDATTAEQFQKIDKKIDSIIEGIDSEPQNYQKLNYQKKNGNKDKYKKLGHLKYPNINKLENTDEESTKKMPLKNIPRVVVNITRETLKNYQKREKELAIKKDYNQVVPLKSFKNENQVKWEIYQQIDKQLSEQSLRLFNQILTLLAEKITSSVNKINLEKEDRINLLNLQKTFVKKIDEYKMEKTDFSRQEMNDIKKDIDAFSKKIIEKMDQSQNSHELKILKDKIDKLESIFKAYKKYNAMCEKVLELKKEILDKDLENNLNSDWRKFPDIKYQKENNLGKNAKYHNGNPIYNNAFLK